MKTILVTGGLGFIGSNVIQYLFDKYPDYKIIVLDAMTYAGSIHNSPEKAFESDRYTFWYGDIRNGELVNTLVSQADIVLHMAAESHVTRSIFDNSLFFETDVIGTQRIANAVLKNADTVELFIHISSSEVYGTALAEQMDEEHPLNPMSPYASAKCGADRLVYSYWTTYQIPAVIVRPFNNYGPRQHLEKAVPRFITSCILEEPITVHGDGSAARDWLYVEDHAKALDTLMHTDSSKTAGQVFNLGTGGHMTISEIAHAVRKLMGDPVKSPIEFIGDRPGQVNRHTCDPKKTTEILNWQATTPFEEGLQTTIDWYLAHRDWWEPQRWLRHIPIVTAKGKREMH